MSDAQNETRADIKPAHMTRWDLLCALYERELSPAVVLNELQSRALDAQVAADDRFWNSVRAAFIVGAVTGLVLCYVFMHISRA